MESTFEKIMRKTGTKPVACKCIDCKKQCLINPCLGTPEDIQKIIDAGYGARLRPTLWKAGVVYLGVTDKEVEMVQPHFDQDKKACTFFTDGLCELHTQGLKPTEGKLSLHGGRTTNFNAKKSIAWAVAKEWLNISKDRLNEIINSL